MIADQRTDRRIETLAGPGRASGKWSVPCAAFAIAFAGTFALALTQGAKPFYYDSGSYWLLGESFVEHGSFSLLNFSSPLRGYLLPLIEHGLDAVSNVLASRSSTAVKLFNTFIVVLISTILAPRLAEIAFPEQHWNVGHRLALTVTLLIFWGGYLSFPLSDFPALAMVLLALIAVTYFDRPRWMLLAGLATGAAIDVRPSYTPLVLIVLALVVWAWLDRRDREPDSTARRALCLGLLLAGLFVVSLPQSLLSHRHFGTWSFVPGSAAHLEGLQLTLGLRTQRYETFVGSGHPPQMFYGDEAGRRLLAEQPGVIVTGGRRYLGLVVDHPLTMSNVFLRHIVNGLDQRYNTPYIEHLDTGSHRWLRLAGFLIIFLALLRVLWPAARHSLGYARWRYTIALLLCCITSLPSAMETRFLLPVSLLCYILVIAPGWPSPIASRETGLYRYRTAGTMLVAYFVFMAVVWHVTSAATAQLSFV